MASVVTLDDVLPHYSVAPPSIQRTLSVGRDLLPPVDDDHDVDPDDDRTYQAYTGGCSLRAAQWEMLPELSGCYFDSDDREELLELGEGYYSQWVTEPTFLVFDHEVDGVSDGHTLLLKASKRGNDVGNANMRYRLSGLRDEIGDMVRVSRPPGWRPGREVVARTNALLVTFTFDPGRADHAGYSIDDAWGAVGPQWNRAITGLRNEYGKIAVIRVWEAHRSGYPHIHALLLFDTAAFDVALWSSPSGGDKWILRDRRERDAMAARWGLGFVDVQGVVNGREGLAYILKYVVGLGKGRDPHPSKWAGDSVPMDIRTASLCWLFRKRQIGISGRPLLDLIRRCVTQITITTQMTLFGGKVGVERWNMVGTVCLEAHDDRPPPWTLTTEGVDDLGRMVRAYMRRRGR